MSFEDRRMQSTQYLHNAVHLIDGSMPSPFIMHYAYCITIFTHQCSNKTNFSRHFGKDKDSSPSDACVLYVQSFSKLQQNTYAYIKKIRKGFVFRNSGKRPFIFWQQNENSGIDYCAVGTEDIEKNHNWLMNIFD